MSLPEMWVQARLTDVCELNPRLLAEDRPADDTTTTFVPMSAVDEHGGVINKAETRTFAEVSKGYTSFREHDVLFAKVTPCMENGKAAIARNLENGLGFGSTEFHVLRPTATVLPEFVFSFVRQKAFRDRAAAAFVGTGGLQRVPPDFLSRVKIPLPTLPEQQRIVDVLQQADGFRRAKQEAIKLCSELNKALFEKHFGIAGATNQWPMESFGKFVTYSKYGPRFPDQAYSETGIHVLRTTDMNNDGTIRWWESPRLALTEKQIEEHTLKPGTLVVSRSGTIGPFALFDGPKDQCVAGAYLIEFGLADSIEPEYVRALFSTPYLQQMLRKAARSAALPNINAPNVRTIRIPVPPPELQEAFSQQIKCFRKWKKQLIASVESIEDLYQAIVGEAFSGDLTKAWRNKYAAEVAEAIHTRDTLLRERGTKVIDASAKAAVTSTAQADASVIPARHWLLAELSEFQRQVLTAFTDYCQQSGQPLLVEDPEVFARFCDDSSVVDRLKAFGLSHGNRIRRSLSQLSALGLIAKITLPKQDLESGERDYLKAFRPIRPEEFTRMADVQTLRKALSTGVDQRAYYFELQLDYATSEHAGAGRMFQVISVEDRDGKDFTHLVDQGRHYASLNDLQNDIASALNVTPGQIELEEV